MCVQAIFSLLDVLKKFVADLKDQAARDEGKSWQRQTKLVDTTRFWNPCISNLKIRHSTEKLNIFANCKNRPKSIVKMQRRKQLWQAGKTVWKRLEGERDT